MSVSAVRGGLGANGSSSLNQNVEPLPSSLSIPSEPPISSVSCLEIARPKPVPPYFRVVDESAWVNFSKRVGIARSGIPTPVSSTDIRRSAFPLVLPIDSTETSVWPSVVNWIAFPTKLLRT